MDDCIRRFRCASTDIPAEKCEQTSQHQKSMKKSRFLGHKNIGLHMDDSSGASATLNLRMAYKERAWFLSLCLGTVKNPGN